jgi:AraC family transcriptional regulator, dual regulator of chb operon
MTALTADTLVAKLHTFTSEELFYKKLSEAEQKPTVLHNFLLELSPEKVRRENWIVPEWAWTLKNRDMDEPFIFKQDSSRNVYLRKHPCYTPVFTHHHDFFEFVYVLEGFCVQSIKNNEFHMEQGDFCLISPNVNHTIKVFDQSIIINIIIRKSNFDDIFFNFLRRKNLISAFCNENLFKRYITDYLLFHTGFDDELKMLVLEMFTESENEEKYDIELLDYQVVILFMKILKKYGDNCTIPSECWKNDTVASDILAYIQTNFSNITLSQIAGQFHYSEEYTSRLIKKITGITFQKMLLKIRMNKAKDFLTDTNAAIENISHQIGYINPEHFIRIFKKQFNMTPGEYRKRFSRTCSDNFIV